MELKLVRLYIKKQKRKKKKKTKIIIEPKTQKNTYFQTKTCFSFVYQIHKFSS